MVQVVLFANKLIMAVLSIFIDHQHYLIWHVSHAPFITTFSTWQQLETPWFMKRNPPLTSKFRIIWFEIKVFTIMF